MSEISEGRQHEHLVKRQASAANYPWCLHHRMCFHNYAEDQARKTQRYIARDWQPRKTPEVRHLRRKAAQASRQKTSFSCKLPFGAFITGLPSRRVLVNKHIDSRMPPTILLMFDRGPAFSATCLKSQKEGSTNISSKDKLQLQIDNYAEDQAWKTQRYIARD